MIKRDYYEVLNITKGASDVEIKKAYRRLAMEYHPDRNQHDPDAEEKFKEASEAYEVLSDQQKRQIYDTYGHQGLEGRGFHGFTDIDDIFGSMGSIFEEFFGGMGGFGTHAHGTRSRRAYAGADLRHDLRLTFLEAARGAEREITFMRHVSCEACSGSGQKPGTGRAVCKACGGSGHVTQRQGFFVLQTTCPQCRGEGSRIEHFCDECRGAGRVRKESKVQVKIPAGIEDGMQLVLRGQGEKGDPGAPSGDLYVFVTVEPHERFQRQGADLLLDLPISFPEAALGGKKAIPKLEGELTIEIPQGAETGDEMKLRGEGLPDVHRAGSKGNLIVRFLVKTPKKLSKKQKDLLRKLADEL